MEEQTCCRLKGNVQYFLFTWVECSMCWKPSTVNQLSVLWIATWCCELTTVLWIATWCCELTTVLWIATWCCELTICPVDSYLVL